MAFTREQLDYLVKLGPIDKIMKVVRPTLGYGQEDWFKYSASELAGEVLRERARAEAAEDKLHDVEEDFDTLELELKATHDRGEKSACELVDMKQHVKFWQEECRKNQFRAESAEAERDILQWASDHSGGKVEPEPYYGSFKIETETDLETVIGSGCGGSKATDDNWYVHKFGPLGQWISSEPKKPDPHPDGECACRGDRSDLVREARNPPICKPGTLPYSSLEEERAEYFAGELLACDGRPHEALVWALFYSDGISVNEADSMLKAWRARWPEPNEDRR